MLTVAVVQPSKEILAGHEVRSSISLIFIKGWIIRANITTFSCKYHWEGTQKTCILQQAEQFVKNIDRKKSLRC